MLKRRNKIVACIAKIVGENVVTDKGKVLMRYWSKNWRVEIDHSDVVFKIMN